jgi:hypothetical protein
MLLDPPGRISAAEWASATDLGRMIEVCRGRISDRKFRLFACACCRRLLQTRDRKQRPNFYQGVIEAVERYVDGQKPTRADGSVLDNDAYSGGDDLESWALGRTGQISTSAISTAIETATLARDAVGQRASGEVLSRHGAFEEAEAAVRAAQGEEQAGQCAALRDIVGFPAEPVTFDSAWRTKAVTDLARQMYDKRAFDRFPRLAGLLEKAGCQNPSLLDHCRSPGEHYRGCWVLDLILEKR